MSYKPEKILEGAPNARDLGGIKTKDGAAVRAGRLIRSGPIHEITDDDKRYLQNTGLNKVIDFRAEQEKSRRMDVILPGVEYIDCPIIDSRAIGITQELPRDGDALAEYYVGAAAGINERGGGAVNMCRMYSSFMEKEFALEHYRQFFDILLSNEKGAALYHCTMGKDRVGAGTALLLTALDVHRDDIYEDYLYTKVRLNELSLELIERCRKFTDDEAILDTIYAMDTVDVSYLNAVFSAMESISGSTEIFMRDYLGITDNKRDILRNLYLQ